MAGNNLTKSSLVRAMFVMGLQSLAGSLAIMIFNLTDTFFVSRLGTDALAAMGFTLPVVMVIGFLAMGIGMGAASVISRAVGQNNFKLARRTTTDGIFLAVTVTAAISLVGYFTIDIVFGDFLGAQGRSLELVRDYMSIWYLFAFAAIIPPVGDGCMRATGEMLRPLAVMSTCAVLNIILDPILIFGMFGLPAMGMKGAALATGISRIFGVMLNFYFIQFHCHLFEWKHPHFAEILSSWKRIIVIGLPASLVRGLMPVSRGILTKLAAMSAGIPAVAALSSGFRIEDFFLSVQMAYSIALIPAIGQNWGAGAHGRVKEVINITTKFAVILSVVKFVIFLLFARFFAGIFTDEPEIIIKTAQYLIFISIGHLGLHLTVWMCQSLIATGQSVKAAIISIIQVFILQLPIAILGLKAAGFEGMIIGIALGQLIAGFGARFIAGRYLELKQF